MNTDPSLERTPNRNERTATSRSFTIPELIRELTRLYQDAGLPQPLARQAALADLESEYGAVALAA